MTPEDHMGDVIGDLNSRRGIVQEFTDKPGGMKVRGCCSEHPGRWPSTGHAQAGGCCAVVAHQRAPANCPQATLLPAASRSHTPSFVCSLSCSAAGQG